MLSIRVPTRTSFEALCSVGAVLVFLSVVCPAASVQAQLLDYPGQANPLDRPLSPTSAPSTHDTSAAAAASEDDSESSEPSSDDWDSGDRQEEDWEEDGWEEREREESKFSLNGSLKLQGGVFVPMASDRFKERRNAAYITRQDGVNFRPQYDQPCDPVAQPHAPCYSYDHGQKAGTPSIARATLLLEAHYQPTETMSLHAILRGVRSMKLDADGYAQIPNVREDLDGAQRRAYARDWVHDNYYTEFDLRELYLDASPTDWLSLRLGRQQVAWGEAMSFRLLDVINPTNNTWHFGPLESFEDTRIPLWMANVTFAVAKLNGSLEVLLVPLLDRPQDTVNVPLTFGGAWGLPYTDSPATFFAPRKVFAYPGGKLADARAGARWKGELGSSAGYSLAYYYTHQIGMPIPDYFLEKGRNESGVMVADKYVLAYPRNHVVGGTLEYSLPSPLSTTLRLEAAVVPNNVVPARTDSGYTRDPNIANRNNYHPQRRPKVSYAVSLQRSTMLRLLNPTQSFIFFAQFSHTMLPTLDVEGEDQLLVQVPLYNRWQAQKHTMAVVGSIRTSYRHGTIQPRVSGAWLPNLYAGDSGFYTVDVDFRVATNYFLNLRVTEFIGADPYRELGLFRGRDELHASLTLQY